MLKITLEEYVEFRDFFQKKTGMFFHENKRYFVDKKIEERVLASGSMSFRAYFTNLKYAVDGSELQKIVNLLTVNETYFFREDYQFKALVDHMLDEVAKRKKKDEPIRIWSIPCSTGEEPYSIIIYLLEYWKGIDNYNVEIIASDIDSGVLHKAEKGVFSARSLQNVSAELKLKYFKKLSIGTFEIIKDLRESVEFTLLNVHDKLSVRHYYDIDVIFCRNMLIYFDAESRKSTLDSFFTSMKPGGFICLGHSEYMSQITERFKLRNFPGAMVYQKPG